MPIKNLKAAKLASPFRKIALGSWNTVGDPSVYGLIEVDVSEVAKATQKIQEKLGVKVTYSHWIAAAAARVLKERPEINSILRMGRIYHRPSVDIFFQVNIPGQGPDKVKKATLSGAVIRKSEDLSALGIAQKLNEKAMAIRDGKDKEMGKSINMLSKIPTFLIKTVLNISSFLNYDLNWPMHWLGTPADPFGSIMITNVGSLGVRYAWAPLVPYTRVPLLLTVGETHDQVVPVDGAPAIRPMLPVCVTFDHRLMDGVHAAHMSQVFKQCFANPIENLLSEAERALLN